MSETNKTFQIKSDDLGDVRVSEEVVAIIAGLAAVEVELRLVFPDKVDNTIAKANLHNTYQEVISFYLEQEGYTYFGCSDVNYGNDVFIEKVNKGELELFDITKKLEYGTYFTLNIYFTK